MFYLEKIPHGPESSHDQEAQSLINLSDLVQTPVVRAISHNLWRSFGNPQIGIWMGGTTYVLCLNDCSPVAHASINPRPMPMLSKAQLGWDSPSHYLYNVCTVPEYRGRGLMKTLLRSLLNDLPKGSCVLLEVDPSNVPAVQLYLGLGFVFGVQVGQSSIQMIFSS